MNPNKPWAPSLAGIIDEVEQILGTPTITIAMEDLRRAVELTRTGMPRLTASEKDAITNAALHLVTAFKVVQLGLPLPPGTIICLFDSVKWLDVNKKQRHDTLVEALAKATQVPVLTVPAGATLAIKTLGALADIDAAGKDVLLAMLKRHCDILDNQHVYETAARIVDYIISDFLELLVERGFAHKAYLKNRILDRLKYFAELIVPANAADWPDFTDEEIGL